MWLPLLLGIERSKYMTYGRILQHRRTRVSFLSCWSLCSVVWSHLICFPSSTFFPSCVSRSLFFILLTYCLASQICTYHIPFIFIFDAISFWVPFDVFKCLQKLFWKFFLWALQNSCLFPCIVGLSLCPYWPSGKMSFLPSTKRNIFTVNFVE